MNTSVVTIFLVFILLISLIDGVEERGYKLSRKDVEEIENRLLLQNNYTVKSIHTSHGDIYDCINVYKQPGFDHNLSNTHSFIPKNIPSLSDESEQNFFVRHQSLSLDGGGCPSETVPIRRLNKEDLVRAKIAMKSRSSSNTMKTYVAMCFDREPVSFSGAQAMITAYNPPVNYTQFSAARMKLHFGQDSIEAGWRVDPRLYGDNQTRFYIRTDVGDIHCFNDHCPGFVITDRSIPLDQVVEVSQPGVLPFWGIEVDIAKDFETGHWILRTRSNGHTAVGYWPGSLFQETGLADYVEWGGEVFGWEVRPEMGSGYPLSADILTDSFFYWVKVMNPLREDGKAVDPINVRCRSDYLNYSAWPRRNYSMFEFVIYFGGPESTN